MTGLKRLLAASVKANAYGHGLTQVVAILRELSAVEYLSVHSMSEAAECREAGWDRRILLLGPFINNEAKSILKLDIEPVICTLDALRAVGDISEQANRPILVHLKLETGTNRQGVREDELAGYAEIFKKFTYLKKPHGASMHFANIEDTTNHDYARQQLEKFVVMVDRMDALGIKPKIRHTASSAALILFEKTRFEMVRPGLSVYGHWPSKETYLSYMMEGGENNLFHPTLSWHTRITQLKKLDADSFIGYGKTYRTTAPTNIAILPVGYADGYPRSLSNKGYVLIRGCRAPIRGRICMNLCMVDITHIKRVKLYDKVTLIGKDKKEELSAEQIADWADSIQYEILARISPAIPRITVS